MPLEPGTRLGPYEVLSLLGEGGMGRVYRARDTKLNREVAIKVLPELFAADRDRVLRFEREAQTLAALNHPHIAQVYGALESPAALVMELVDGEDLSQRIARGPIPLDDALPIARQIAEALEAAHERGIVHRDLKPANITIREDGTVKVLDFGLAKAMDPAVDGPLASGPSNSPTFTSPALTQMGIILGTAAYMAPEQAKGRLVDRRADVWAFGCVLFEMLTGRRAFPGEDVTETLASVIKSDAEWRHLPMDTPAPIRRLLRRCLEKDPRVRLRDMGSALLEIRDAADGDATDAPHDGSAPRRSGPRAAVAAMAVLVLALAGVTSWSLWRVGPDATGVDRLTIALPASDELPRAAGNLLAISSDGRTVAYTVLRNRDRVIVRRSLDAFDATAIAGTEGARDPFLSHDGQWLGATRLERLIKVPIGGGTAITIAELPSAIRGADWLPDGRILLGSNGPFGLLEVPSAGGSLTTLHNPDDGRVWYPQQLPDGESILFTLVPRPTRSDPNLRAPVRFAAELRILDRRTGQTRRILENASAGRLLPSGFLVFERDEAIWAVAFDLDRLEPVGSAVPAVPGLRVEGGRAVQMVVAPDGTLVYVSGAPRGASQKQLLWVTRSQQQETVRTPARDFIGLRLSPDGRRAAVQLIEGDGADLWVTELALGTLTRISNTGSGENPLWSRDGRSIVFSSLQDQRWHLFRKAADGTGDVETLASFDPAVNRVQATAWLPDGGLLVELATREDDGDIGVLPLAGDRAWRPVVRTAGFEGHSALSPDGRWLAYTSDASGEGQVYVQPFPGPGPRQQVPGPGWAPSWSATGREIVYLSGSPPRYVMSVAVQTGDPLILGTPEQVLDFAFYDRRSTSRFYDAAADGRLLFISRGPTRTDDEGQLRVVLNWVEELRRLASEQ